jgi:hypothetical protein
MKGGRFGALKSDSTHKGKVYKQTKSANNWKTVKTVMTRLGTGIFKEMVG